MLVARLRGVRAATAPTPATVCFAKMQRHLQEDGVANSSGVQASCERRPYPQAGVQAWNPYLQLFHKLVPCPVAGRWQCEDPSIQQAIIKLPEGDFGVGGLITGKVFHAAQNFTPHLQETFIPLVAGGWCLQHLPTNGIRQHAGAGAACMETQGLPQTAAYDMAPSHGAGLLRAAMLISILAQSAESLPQTAA